MLARQDLPYIITTFLLLTATGTSAFLLPPASGPFIAHTPSVHIHAHSLPHAHKSGKASFGLALQALRAAPSRAFTTGRAISPFYRSLQTRTIIGGRETGGSFRSFWMSRLGLGFDFGTSGARINVVDDESLRVVYSAERAYSEQTAVVWSRAMDQLINSIPAEVRAKIQRVAVSGTSATVLIADRRTRTVTRGPRMYDFSVSEDVPCGDKAMKEIENFAPEGNTVRSSSSTLAKVLSWCMEKGLGATESVCHQADYLAFRLLPMNQPFTSDWNNALKIGYDVSSLAYPEWMMALLKANGVDVSVLPKIVPPGGIIGVICPDAASRYGLPESCEIVGGTTDSISAFIAARASKPGQAVTSLGSTLAIKLLSSVRVDDSKYGVYSHRLGDLWLVGGASNVGCAVLRQQKFSSDEIVTLSEKIDPGSKPPDGIRYYPLTKKGERFPVNDANKEPILEPVPESRQEFLQGLLYGIAEVERDGYKVLADMGATPVTEVLTAGGGSVNVMWGEMRKGLLGVPVERAQNTDAAYGIALLALGKHM